uniref:Uncharacterized protein n=1 Tax=Lactuca sativa TaxID=4236 RepID=A0A9R1XVF2_LACSA|nr:hypothetical protein LSAT_V11C100033930 [Lactuca sativa]
MITLSSAFKKENSLDDEGKCLMAHIVESHADTNSIGTLDVDPSQATADLKTEWDATTAYQCSISNSKPEDQSKSSTSDESSIHHEPHDKVLSEHTIDEIPCSVTKTRTLKSNNQISSDSAVEKKSKPNVKGKNLGIKVCYR